MHRMSPQDASFLHIEDAVTHMHIGSVCAFEGPPPSHDEILRAIASKLPLVPRYRQKVRFVPLSLGRPVWVDDPHFVLDYHVRHTALPAPGGDAELRNLVGRIMSQQLDRAKPLWEIWVAEGLDDNRWAVISKTHHCMVDGVASTDLMTVLFDDRRDAAAAARDVWRPEPEPNPAQLVSQALAERAASPYEGVRTVAAGLRGPRMLARNVVRGARGVSRTATLLRPTPPTSLNGPLGPHRRWDWARGRLGDVKTIRQALGGTVNDVVLAAITAGFRELLAARGELAEGRFVRTMVPVSVRAQAERGTYNNKVSALFAELPVCISDPVERLDAVRAQMEGLKQSGQAVGGEVLTSLSGFAPAMLLALGGRVATRMPQRNVNTVTTNVPGPQTALFFSGRRMLEAFPYVPLGGHVRVGVAIFSYDGALNFGATGDYDTAPDIELLCRGIEAGLAELLDVAQTRARPNGAKRRTAKTGTRTAAARSRPAVRPVK
jgi:diacylglycerol O-acyltransferase / wax synthase